MPTSRSSAVRTLIIAALASSASPTFAVFTTPAAKDGVIYGANLRAPRGVLLLGGEMHFTDADLGVCRAVPIYDPVSAPGDAVLTVSPGSCVEVIAAGAPVSFPVADPGGAGTVDLVLVPRQQPTPGVARLVRSGTALQLVDVVTPAPGLLPSAVAYSYDDGYAYVAYSNSDRIDRFSATASDPAAALETCLQTSNGAGTRALAFAGPHLVVAQDGGPGGALAIAENLAFTSCPLVAGPIAPATSFGHPTFGAISGLAAEATGDGFTHWLFVAEIIDGAALVHRLKIVGATGGPDVLFTPEHYTHTGRYVDLKTTDAYRGNVGLTYLRPPQLPGADGPGVLFISDDPDPATLQPGGRVWFASDLLPPTITSPATGAVVAQVSIRGSWNAEDRWARSGFAPIALLHDEEGYIVGSGDADASAGGAFILAYPNTVPGERSFVVRMSDSGTEGATFNISPPSEVLRVVVSPADGDVTPPAAPTFTSPAAGSVLRGASVSFAGSAEPGSTITLTVDGQLVATLSVSATGTWSVGATLVAGPHAASAVARDAAGNSSAPATLSFAVELDGGTPGGVGPGGGGGGGGCSTGGGGSTAWLALAGLALVRRRRSGQDQW